MRGLRALFRRWFYGSSKWSDDERELQDHLDLETDHLTDMGSSRGEARDLAHRNLGNTTAIKETVYENTWAGAVDHCSREFRHALRSLLREPAFTMTAVLSLALGIGGTTAIFTLIDATMLRPLPVSDPGHLYRVGNGDDTIALGRHGEWGFFSFPLYQRLKDATPEFENITAFDWGGNHLSVRREGTADAAKALLAQYVTGTYFSTLGVGAFSGRVFAADDDRPSALPVAVLSHSAWQGVYGSDSSVVGSTIVVEGHPFTVIGVAAAGFFGESIRAYRPDIWIPLQQERMIARDRSFLNQSVPSWLAVIGRLRRDASITGMDSRLSGILHRWIQYESAYPNSWMPNILRDLPKQTIRIVPAGTGIGMGGLSVKEQYGTSLQILLAICGLVLLIACANVANLLLARAVARRPQTAVRLALGARRRQIIGAALTESVLLAAAGGMGGLLVALGAARLLVALAFRGSEFVPVTATPSLSVLAFAAGLSLVTGIAFGTAPAWFATRTNPIDALRGSGRSTGHHSSSARTALLIIQATLSVVLVSGAIMLARSLSNLEHQDFGYRVQGRVLVDLKRLPATYTPERLSSLYAEIDRRLAGLPGVRGTGLTLYNPLTNSWTETIVVSGHPPNASNESSATWDRVSAHYLQNLGVTLVRGRLFTAQDNERTAPVAVINESFAKRFFKESEDPIDQHFGIELPENADTFRIVGIVRDSKFAWSGLGRPAAPMFFVPLGQHEEYKSNQGQVALVGAMSHFIQGIMLVTDASPGDLEPLLRKTLAEADPNVTILHVSTMQEQIDFLLNRERVVARLAEVFAMIALVLAAVGVYGVTAYMVAQQVNEIGIRIALGAGRADVVAMVLLEAFRRVACGLIVGLPLAIGAARLIAAQLYAVSFWDPLALAFAAGSLGACAFVAAIIPAGRAAAISPMTALRAE